jgi:hypothetical protein
MRRERRIDWCMSIHCPALIDPFTELHTRLLYQYEKQGTEWDDQYHYPYPVDAIGLFR